MNISRRQFGSTSLLSIASLSLVGIGDSILTGCPSQTTIAEWVNVIGTESSTIVAALGNSTLAGQIASATATAVKDVDNFTSGASAEVAIQALNDLLGFINLIPAATPYEPIIGVIVGAIDAVLALIPTSTTAASPAAAKAHAAIFSSPHVVVKVKNYNDFKKQTNAFAKAHPELHLLKVS